MFENNKKINLTEDRINAILKNNVENATINFNDTDDINSDVENFTKKEIILNEIVDLDDEEDYSSNMLSKEELFEKYKNIENKQVKIVNDNKDTFKKVDKINKINKKKISILSINDIKKIREKTKEKKKAKDALKKEIKENFTGFNKINGYIPKYDLIINELNDYVAILKCLDFNSIKHLIDNMDKFDIKEVEIFTNHHEYYVSLRFINNYKNNTNNYDSQLKELDKIGADLNLIAKSDVEFVRLSILQIFKILREKVFREDTFSDSEIEKIINNQSKTKAEFQRKIFAKNVEINNDYIEFNKNNDGDRNIIKHQIIGLQLYPSYLYEGYMSEINYLKGVQTTTYIKNINKENILKNLDENINEDSSYAIIKKDLENVNKIFNTCFFIHIYGTEEVINKTKEKLYAISDKYHVMINDFVKQQRRAYSAFLPLMNNRIKCYRKIDNLNGIMPQNDEIIENFKCNMYYGIEQNSGNKFYFKRKTSGIILSSNIETKNEFIQNERDFFFANERKHYEVIDFNSFNDKNIDKKLYEVVSKGKDDKNLDFYKRYLLFKMWVYLCVAHNKDITNIEKNDREALNYAFLKLEEKYFNNDAKYEIVIEKFNSFLKKTNEKLFNKIKKYINSPNDALNIRFNFIYKIIVKTNTETEPKNIYVYNIQEIIDCLDVLFEYIFTNEFSNMFLFSSSNDFALLNNRYVSEKIFKAPYINIYDVQNNDLVKINDKINLSNDDIVFLNDKSRINGKLLTNICEFNYYKEKDNTEDVI